MSNQASTLAAPAEGTPAISKLGLSLLVIATAQLMLVLDDTIANIALPSIQRELGVSAATLPWIVNAYVLAFGSLLLFGGRVGDLYGRRRVFQVGLGVFTLASLLGGMGVNAGMLIASRGLQGLGAALVAPNALALITTTFPVGAPRNRAMAVYGAMSALGITIGVLLGGVLVGLLSWRWVFFINAPIGLAVLVGTRALVEGQRNRGRLDAVDALSGTGAMFALAYGITRGGEHGWGEALTVGAFVAALLLGSLFVALQARREHPMLPLALFRDRNRSGAYATMLFVGAGLMGTFYLLTLYLQEVLRFSPVRTGLSSLPFSAGIVLGAGISSKLVERLAPRAVAGPGLVVGAAGMFRLSMLSVDSSYATHVLPAVFLTSLGLGLSAVAMTLTAVHGVSEERAGVASAVVNMAQQLGAALGLAVFTTISLTAAETRLPGAAKTLHEGLSAHDPDVLARAGAALSHGYTTAFLSGAALLLLAAVVVLAAVTSRHQNASAP
ncbi:MFS transporter [Archangium gephyra]|uniref:MFS transporter n=1 Tax=Archangium gephyra TaxID=48 RepID=UPI003B80D650